MHTPTYGTGSIDYTVGSPLELVTLYEHLHETRQLPARLDSKHYSAPSRLAWYRYHPDIKNHPQKVEYRLTLSIYPTAYVKSESLVIAGQHTAVNTFPGLVHTARQVTKVGNTQSRWPNPFGREPSKVGLAIGTKS